MRRLAIFFLCIGAFGQTKAPELTEVQKLHLQIAQKDAIIAQAQAQQAQQAFQNAVNNFNSVCLDIKKANKFPDSYLCDIGTASIKAPEAKKEPAKP